MAIAKKTITDLMNKVSKLIQTEKNIMFENLFSVSLGALLKIVKKCPNGLKVTFVLIEKRYI